MADELLSELVIGQQQVVSYRLLSRKLKCHVNTAKEYLWSYLNQNSNEVSASYVVTGWKTVTDQVKGSQGEGNEDGDGDVTMSNTEPKAPESRKVREVVFVEDQSKLEESKRQFDRVSSVQVYSIAPGSTGTTASANQTVLDSDSSAVSLLDRELTLGDIFDTIGVIRNNKLSEEVWQTRCKSKIAASTASSSSRNAPAAKKTAQAETVKKEQPPPKKGGGLANAFKNAKPKAQGSASKKQEQEQKKKADEEAELKRKRQIELEKQQHKKKTEEDEAKLQDLFSDEDEDDDVKMETVDDQLLAADEEKTRQENEQPGPQSESQSSVTEVKPEQDDNDVDIPVERRKGKKKVKKQKTTKTPDGFLETKTVEEWVTDDEEPPTDAKPKPKPKPATNPPASKPPAGKKKAGGDASQKSLMSFFGKKK